MLSIVGYFAWFHKTNATGLAQQYDSVLHTLITLVNLHASLVTKTTPRPRPLNPWMIPAILASKRYRRYLGHVWCRNPTTLKRSRLIRQTHLCNRQVSKTKPALYSKIIAEHSDDHGSLWKAFNKILHRCPKLNLPDPCHLLFFSLWPTLCVLNPPDTRKVLQNLTSLTADEVHRLVHRAVFCLRPNTC